MATTTKKQITSSGSGRVIKSGKPEDPVTRTEYLRRRNLQEKKVNPNAPVIGYRNLNGAINNGGIPIYLFGGNVFIDWVESKDYVFRAWSIHTTLKNKKAKKK